MCAMLLPGKLRMHVRSGTENASLLLNARRCLECIAANDVDNARFASLIWACSTWGHRLQHSELEQLVPVAVDSIAADWPEPGRGGALRLADALTRQVGSRQPCASVYVASSWRRFHSQRMAIGCFTLHLSPLCATAGLPCGA